MLVEFHCIYFEYDFYPKWKVYFFFVFFVKELRKRISMYRQ